MTQPAQINGPYNDSATNLIYNLLFCDNLDLYKSNTDTPYPYPFDVLFSDTSTVDDLQKIIDNENSESRIRILAYNRQRAKGQTSTGKELLAVIIEVGLDEGLDVLASFQDGTARYINHTGRMIIWETTTDASNQLTEALFTNSLEIVNQIGVWDQPRRPHPDTGMVRITFLVSDGIYFGEGPIDVLFNDPMGGPALVSGTELMQYITARA